MVMDMVMDMDTDMDTDTGTGTDMDTMVGDGKRCQQREELSSSLITRKQFAGKLMFLSSVTF
ncbi:hypothetical protein KXD40_006289 [Peronospora effusa]|uniref:Uncharacterized protein n=1 Tax=Peronospora effusa TaxID=542832 RepID=A0A3M6VBY4_9STRA|nr:hypothetical protein DD238_007109 [Peronospora effusa]RQM12297.1 hypothetical protein DD237_006620 [Peronospora effusa]UIZ25400.1 hypothetical protein KXD40_006289 [Peronospora effusa]